MEESKIVNLYWERSECAISETAKQYSRYCYTIAFNILLNNEDAEECVNDAYQRLWNAIPPNYPRCFTAFLGKITRNIALDRYKKYTAKKRGLSQTELALSELSDCIASKSCVEKEIETKELTESINRFLESLTKQKRIMFIQRYWYLMSVNEIANHLNRSESQVKSALFRIRNALKVFLEKEGFIL